MSKKLSIIIITCIVLITSLAGYFGSKLTFDYDFEHFFPQNDPDLEYFLNYRNTYENDNDYLLNAFERILFKVILKKHKYACKSYQGFCRQNLSEPLGFTAQAFSHAA